MNMSIKRIALILILGILFVPQYVFAGTKIFIKEYTYQAGDEDSKNSSRVIALREVKRLLLEELGTYLESQTEVKNFSLTKDQITTLTAGIVRTEIIDEKWDGQRYWLKSKIEADSGQVVRSIDNLRKDREKTRELEAMKQKSDELLREVERLRKELAAGKEDARGARQAAYDRSIKQLSAAEWIEKGHAVSGPDDRFKGAFDAYSRAIELDPSNIAAYYFRARIGGKNQAMSDYYKILSLPAKDSEDHLIRAWTYKELDRRDSALQEFGKAIATAVRNKDKATAYFDRGRYYDLLRPRPYAESSARSIPNASELALSDFSNAIALDPTEPSYFHMRANIYLSLQKDEAAIADFTAGLKIAPNNAGLYSGRGQAYQILKKYELAAADLSRTIELDGDDHLFTTHNYMTRAFLYEQAGRLDLALRDYDKLIVMRPDDASWYRGRAGLYGKTGQFDLALKDYNKALALEPKGVPAARAYYDRALVHAAKGDTRKVVQDLKSAFQNDSGLKAHARAEKRFDRMRENSEFKKLFQQ